MLGVGWTEMLVIGVVALIVIGPKELPALMQKLGRFAGTVRRMGSDFQRELNKTTGLDEVRNLRTAITQPLKQTTDAIRREFNTITPSGTVQPSGLLKPADPNAESVVAEIEKAAGIDRRDAMRAAVTKPGAVVKVEPQPAMTPNAPSTASPPATAPDLTTPAKAKRVRKARAAPTSPVTTTDLFPAEKPAAVQDVSPARKRLVKKKPVESPAPSEAIAPDEAEPKPKRTRKPAAKKS